MGSTLEENGVFSDVASDSWYAGAVQYVYDKGIMNGTSTTTFSPESSTTRAMIVTMLHRMEDEPPAQASRFADVPNDQYYTNAVAWASDNGIVTGYNDTAFGPSDNITREQLATILFRYADYKKYNVEQSADLSGFTDAARISSYAKAAMQWANATGLITGVTSDTIIPQGNATRAQVATILMRFCENVQ